MAKWKNEKNKHHNGGDEKKNDNNGDKPKDKTPKYQGIKVPASELYAMEQGSAQMLIEGGNRLVDVVSVENRKIPIMRELDIAIVEVSVPDGSMKGSTAYWLYHSTQDITLRKTETHIKREKKQRRTELWNKFLNTISFGLI